MLIVVRQNKLMKPFGRGGGCFCDSRSVKKAVKTKAVDLLIACREAG